MIQLRARRDDYLIRSCKFLAKDVYLVGSCKINGYLVSFLQV